MVIARCSLARVKSGTKSVSAAIAATGILTPGSPVMPLIRRFIAMFATEKSLESKAMALVRGDLLFSVVMLGTGSI